MSYWLSNLTSTKQRLVQCKSGSGGEEKKDQRFRLPRQESVTSVTSTQWHEIEGCHRVTSPPTCPDIAPTSSIIATYHLTDDGSSQPVVHRRLSNDARPVAPSRTPSFRSFLTRRFSNDRQPQAAQAAGPVRQAFLTRRFSNESKLEIVEKKSVSRRFSNESAPCATIRHSSLIPAHQGRVEGFGARIRRRFSNDTESEPPDCASPQVSSIHQPRNIDASNIDPKRSSPRRSKSDQRVPSRRPTGIHFLGGSGGARALNTSFNESECYQARSNSAYPDNRRHSISYQQNYHSDPSVSRVGFTSDQDIFDAYEKITSDDVNDRAMKGAEVPKPSSPLKAVGLQENPNKTYQGPPLSPTSVVGRDCISTPPSLPERKNSFFEPTGWE